MTNARAMAGGFDHPVFQSQSVFRQVLDAFARPGTVVNLADVVTPPAPLHVSTAAFICTFADEGTPVHVDAATAEADAAVDWFRFHTGAPIATDPSDAAFAIVTDPAAMPPLDAFALGLPDYPDRSTTIVLQIARFCADHSLQLEGPGIDGCSRIGPDPLPAGFAEQMRCNRLLFPMGVDVVLASPAAVAALPRSVRLSDGRPD